ncbi:MAG: hypothetical protein J6Q17_01975 [Clostridia bacterium]|nr:hypothetical protein [Clostridia bacterium]
MRKRKILRCAAILALLLPLLFAGCRQKPAEGPRWIREDYILPVNWDPISIQSAAGGTLSVVGYHRTGDEKICLFTLTEGGGYTEKRELPEMERLRSPRWEGSTFYGLKDIDEERTFVRYDEEGNLLESRPTAGLMPDEPEFKPVEAVRAPDGTLFLMSYYGIAVVPPEGEASAFRPGLHAEFDRLFLSPDGEAWVWERTQRGWGLSRIDRDRVRLTDLVFLPEEPPQDWQRQITLLGFDAEGRFLWAEKDGINAVVFGEEGVVTKIRLLDYDEEGLDVTKYAASLLPDRRTLVFSRQELEIPRLEGESDAEYQARTGGAKWLSRYIVLHPAG